MIKAEIKQIKLLYKNVPTRRRIKVILTNGKVIHIIPCHESWEQYGGTQDELYMTMPIAEKYNTWLHGK